MKKCSKCKEEKAFDQFGWRRARSTWQSQCNSCRNAKVAEWRERNPGSHKKYRASQRNATLRKKYGIGAEEVERMLEAQGGVCSICGTVGKMVVDHDHATGAVRGIICDPCNRGLGCFYDDPDRLRGAINYLTS